MNWLNVKRLVSCLALLGVIPAASAQSADQLIASYTGFAGSAANAAALVEGVRNGSDIVMTESEVISIPPPSGYLGGLAVPTTTSTTLVTVTCTPQTGNMGYGNVDHALSLARSVLAAVHIVETTPQSHQRGVKAADICAALTGGKVTPKGGAEILLTGILQLRADGLGWGQIAKQVKLAP
jgi:hypothetical protein